MQETKWIWLDREYKADRYAEFYDTVEYGSERAILKISCDSNYAVYVNEKLAAFGQYADYPWYKVYDVIDLTESLRRGKNAVKIVVWFYGESFSTYYKNRPGLWYEISVGEQKACRSNAKTLCRESVNYANGSKKIITHQLGYSFCYDTRGKTAKLSSACEVPPLAEKLYLRPCDTLTAGPIRKGVLIEKETKLYDLGAEYAGLFYIVFESESGVKLNIAYGEHAENKKVSRCIGERDFSVEIIGNGKRVEYVNPFRRLGARYLQAEGDGKFEIEEIGLIETNYPVKEVPFHAKNSLTQQIYDTAVRTLKLCMHEHYEDTPWREQSLYCFDGRNQMLCGYFAFREFRFAKSNLKLMAESRRKDKLLPICFPSSVDLTIPSFSLYYIIAAEEYLRYSGDREFVASIFPRLREITEVFLNRAENGIVPQFYGDASYWNFYDWAEGLAGNLGEKGEKIFDLILNGLLSLAFIRMDAIAEGLHIESSEYKIRAEKLNAEINARFYDKRKKIYRTFENKEHFSETGNALAVLCGAAEDAEAIAEQCARGKTTESSLSMKCFLYDALLKADPEKYGQYVLRDIEARYEKMLRAGATSFWETKEGARAFGGAGSLCHGWSAMPVYYYHILKDSL